MPKNWQQTFSGRVLDPRNPDATSVTIEDVAHALAMKCRFAGQCTHFYSVAEHCVRGSHIVPSEYALAFLLHELDEVFLPDVPGPIKASVYFDDGQAMISWKTLAARHERAILSALNLPALETHAPEVKRADLQMLAWEARDLMSAPPKSWELTESPPRHAPAMHPWSPTYAEFRFLDAWDTLRGGGVHTKHCEVRG